MKLLAVAVVLLLAQADARKIEGVDKRFILSNIFGGGKTATSYIGCCAAVPQIDSLTNEANQLRLNVQSCQARLQDVVSKISGSTSGKRGIFDLILAPLKIATEVIKLPFAIAGQVAAIPFNLAKGLADAVSPIIGQKLSDIIKFPIDFAQRVIAIPFQFSAAVVSLPLGIVNEISGWSFSSNAEREKAKACCIKVSGLPNFLAYVQELNSAQALCESKLRELEVLVDEILNKPECPAGFYYSDTTRRCYAVFGNPTTYSEGQQLCSGVGGVLASIRSQDEQTLIENIANGIPDTSQCRCNRGGACFTTSGQTLDPNQCGHTSDGRLVWKPKAGYYMEIGYTNWKSGEPNCYGGTEHCIVLDTYFNYQWNDYSCNVRSCPICEADPKPKVG